MIKTTREVIRKWVTEVDDVALGDEWIDINGHYNNST